jgi:hypothetical protein
MWTTGTDIIDSINNAWQLALKPTLSEEELVQALAGHINTLIVEDFPKLIQMLYRIDVNETKLKEMLRSHKDTDAALMIAHLVVERQKQKKRSRDMYSRRPGEGDPEY